MDKPPTLTTEEQRFHRFRHYPEGWSPFDMVELCAKPKWCIGCEYHHPFCTESGRVTSDEIARTDPLVRRLLYARR